MSVKVIGIHVRKVYREVCGECHSMLEYGREDIHRKNVECTCRESGCDREYPWEYVKCPSCMHEVPHDQTNPAMTVYDQVGR
jgi:hypothetical protein